MNAVIQIRHGSRILKAAALYFAVVFGVGFVLGIIRVLFVVPILGVRNAELLEQPLMLAAVFVAARWVGRRFAVGLTQVESLLIGLAALSLLVVAEVLVALLLQPDRPRDPVSGAVYAVMLSMFALMPGLLSIRK